MGRRRWEIALYLSLFLSFRIVGVKQTIVNNVGHTESTSSRIANKFQFAEQVPGINKYEKFSEIVNK